MDISTLLNSIRDTHQWFAGQAARQIDTSLTLRNWIIGMYLVEYEQKGQDRAQYGQKLLSKVSASLRHTHFVELMRRDTDLKRTFYETEAMLNNWNVDELGRAISSMLFERTGLSTDKAAVLEKHRSGSGLDIADFLKNPMVLDFLGLSEKASYTETSLEQAIINHLV